MYLDIQEEDVSTASLTTRRLEQNLVEACWVIARVGISRMRRKSRNGVTHQQPLFRVMQYMIKNEHNQNNFEHNAVFWGKFGIE